MNENRQPSWQKDIPIFLCSALIASLYMFVYTGLTRPRPTGALVWGILMQTLQGLFLWRIFRKAGVPGWKGLIPFYNEYMLWQTFYGKGAFYLTVSVFSASLSFITKDRLKEWESGTDKLFLLIVFLFLLALLVLLIILLVHTYRCAKAVAAAFGKTKRFAFWCLLVFASVGRGILAYDHSVCDLKRPVGK